MYSSKGYRTATVLEVEENRIWPDERLQWNAPDTLSSTQSDQLMLKVRGIHLHQRACGNSADSDERGDVDELDGGALVYPGQLVDLTWLKANARAGTKGGQIIEPIEAVTGYGRALEKPAA